MMASGEEAASVVSNKAPLQLLQQEAAAEQQQQQKKKKRSLPGTPDPDAEVIALSPGSLLATNRFVCEMCGKGFQRDQNLQLHRRGHNLPWKLRQRSGGGNKQKRVYVCPEKSCVHHDPARALGDLTGIKKHFCRKHGEKKWKCERCGKKYAVQSDWKAHSKTCGTREYRCDCGTLFSRRDSFITHRAFCDALAEETARLNKQQQQLLIGGGGAPLLAQQLADQHPHLFSGAVHAPLGGLPGCWLYGNKNAADMSVFSGGHDDMSATALLHKTAQMGAAAGQTHHAGIIKLDHATVQGREETRDFLGVAVQPLCLSMPLPQHMAGRFP